MPGMVSPWLPGSQAIAPGQCTTAGERSNCIQRIPPPEMFWTPLIRTGIVRRREPRSGHPVDLGEGFRLRKDRDGRQLETRQEDRNGHRQDGDDGQLVEQGQMGQGSRDSTSIPAS